MYIIKFLISKDWFNFTYAIHAAHVPPHVTAPADLTCRRPARSEDGRHAAEDTLAPVRTRSRPSNALTWTGAGLGDSLIAAPLIILIVQIVLVSVVVAVVIVALLTTCLASPPSPDLGNVVVIVVPCNPELLRGRHQLALRVRTLRRHKAARPTSLPLKPDSWIIANRFAMHFIIIDKVAKNTHRLLWNTGEGMHRSLGSREKSRQWGQPGRLYPAWTRSETAECSQI